ncbi:MAG: helix-turn-helix domain-containing protein [Saprospiraceae bacterium]|nr:helix-turn-helix domain-containing protein [Saprospiraceae bacterium]
MEVLNGISIDFLSQNIRHLRKRLNISQEELAAKIGLNRGNIASYENGTAEPKICNLLKLAHIFGISITDFTQKDLTRDENYLEAQITFQAERDEEIEVLEDYQQRAAELRNVIESLHTCHSFKVKSTEDLSKDAQVMNTNFEQMYELATKSLHELEEFLEFIKCRSK